MKEVTKGEFRSDTTFDYISSQDIKSSSMVYEIQRGIATAFTQSFADISQDANEVRMQLPPTLTASESLVLQYSQDGLNYTTISDKDVLIDSNGFRWDNTALPTAGPLHYRVLQNEDPESMVMYASDISINNSQPPKELCLMPDFSPPHGSTVDQGQIRVEWPRTYRHAEVSYAGGIHKATSSSQKHGVDLHLKDGLNSIRVREGVCEYRYRLTLDSTEALEVQSFTYSQTSFSPLAQKDSFVTLQADINVGLSNSTFDIRVESQDGQIICQNGVGHMDLNQHRILSGGVPCSAQRAYGKACVQTAGNYTLTLWDGKCTSTDYAAEGLWNLSVTLFGENQNESFGITLPATTVEVFY